LNVHRVLDLLGVEIATADLQTNKTSGSDQIPAELIQVAGKTLRSEIHKLINSILNKEEVLDQWKKSAILTIYKRSDKVECSNYHGIFLLLIS
jgi:hypothetical protein